MIYSATAKGPFKMAGVIDPNAKKTVGLIYKPDNWMANTVYYVRAEDDYDIALPTVFAGLYYKATNPGKSGPTEPVWPTTPGDTVTDGTVVWETVAYNLLPYTESISTSTWVASDSVVLVSPMITGGKTQVMISTIPAGVAAFTLTNHIVKSNNEEDDITLQFKVASR
jgi:hypothetical protein